MHCHTCQPEHHPRIYKSHDITTHLKSLDVTNTMTCISKYFTTLPTLPILTPSQDVFGQRQRLEVGEVEDVEPPSSQEEEEEDDISKKMMADIEEKLKEIQVPKTKVV